MSFKYWIIISIFGWGIGSFFHKFAANQMHPLLIGMVSLATYATILPIGLFFTKVDFDFNTSGIFFTVISSLFMCVGTLGFSFALRSGGSAGATTSLTALYPTITLILSFLFLQEEMSIKKICGVILAILAAIILGL